MKKLIILLLLILVVSGFSGCLQKTEPATNNTTGTGVTASVTVPAGPASNLTISAATISSDIESISKEVTSIDTNGTGITPLNDTDLTVD
jgi:PBP1b-binding outer membrane lipoprotein LpoB